MDPIGFVNVLLNLAIIAIGYAGYRKTKNRIYFYMALAFIVFAVTNLLSALEMSAQFLYPVIVLRVIGYVTVLYGLYAGMGGKK
jgi:hypothetical protein